MALEGGKQLHVGTPSVDHLGDFQRVVVGHTPTSNFAHFVAQLFSQRVCLWAAPMNEHHFYTVGYQRHYVGGQGVEPSGVEHDLAAKLDYESLAAELFQISF